MSTWVTFVISWLSGRTVLESAWISINNQPGMTQTSCRRSSPAIRVVPVISNQWWNHSLFSLFSLKDWKRLIMSEAQTRACLWLSSIFMGYCTGNSPRVKLLNQRATMTPEESEGQQAELWHLGNWALMSVLETHINNTLPTVPTQLSLQWTELAADPSFSFVTKIVYIY